MKALRAGGGTLGGKLDVREEPAAAEPAKHRTTVAATVSPGTAKNPARKGASSLFNDKPQPKSVLEVLRGMR